MSRKSFPKLPTSTEDAHAKSGPKKPQMSYTDLTNNPSFSLANNTFSERDSDDLLDWIDGLKLRASSLFEKQRSELAQLRKEAQREELRQKYREQIDSTSFDKLGALLQQKESQKSTPSIRQVAGKFPRGYAPSSRGSRDSQISDSSEEEEEDEEEEDEEEKEKEIGDAYPEKYASQRETKSGSIGGKSRVHEPKYPSSGASDDDVVEILSDESSGGENEPANPEINYMRKKAGSSAHYYGSEEEEESAEEENEDLIDSQAEEELDEEYGENIENYSENEEQQYGEQHDGEQHDGEQDYSEEEGEGYEFEHYSRISHSQSQQIPPSNHPAHSQSASYSRPRLSDQAYGISFNQKRPQPQSGEDLMEAEDFTEMSDNLDAVEDKYSDEFLEDDVERELNHQNYSESEKESYYGHAQSDVAEESDGIGENDGLEQYSVGSQEECINTAETDLSLAEYAQLESLASQSLDQQMNPSANLFAEENFQFQGEFNDIQTAYQDEAHDEADFDVLTDGSGSPRPEQNESSFHNFAEEGSIADIDEEEPKDEENQREYEEEYEKEYMGSDLNGAQTNSFYSSLIHQAEIVETNNGSKSKLDDVDGSVTSDHLNKEDIQEIASYSDEDAAKSILFADLAQQALSAHADAEADLNDELSAALGEAVEELAKESHESLKNGSEPLVSGSKLDTKGSEKEDDSVEAMADAVEAATNIQREEELNHENKDGGESNGKMIDASPEGSEIEAHPVENTMPSLSESPRFLSFQTIKEEDPKAVLKQLKATQKKFNLKLDAVVKLTDEVGEVSDSSSPSAPSSPGEGQIMFHDAHEAPNPEHSRSSNKRFSVSDFEKPVPPSLANIVDDLERPEVPVLENLENVDLESESTSENEVSAIVFDSFDVDSVVLNEEVNEHAVVIEPVVEEDVLVHYDELTEFDNVEILSPSQIVEPVRPEPASDILKPLLQFVEDVDEESALHPTEIIEPIEEAEPVITETFEETVEFAIPTSIEELESAMNTPILSEKSVDESYPGKTDSAKQFFQNLFDTGRKRGASSSNLFSEDRRGPGSQEDGSQADAEFSESHESSHRDEDLEQEGCRGQAQASSDASVSEKLSEYSPNVQPGNTNTASDLGTQNSYFGSAECSALSPESDANLEDLENYANIDESKSHVDEEDVDSEPVTEPVDEDHKPGTHTSSYRYIFRREKRRMDDAEPSSSPVKKLRKVLSKLNPFHWRQHEATSRDDDANQQPSEAVSEEAVIEESASMSVESEENQIPSLPSFDFPLNREGLTDVPISSGDNFDCPNIEKEEPEEELEEEKAQSADLAMSQVDANEENEVESSETEDANMQTKDGSSEITHVVIGAPPENNFVEEEVVTEDSSSEAVESVNGSDISEMEVSGQIAQQETTSSGNDSEQPIVLSVPPLPSPVSYMRIAEANRELLDEPHEQLDSPSEISEVNAAISQTAEKAVDLAQPVSEVLAYIHETVESQASEDGEAQDSEDDEALGSEDDEAQPSGCHDEVEEVSNGISDEMEASDEVGGVFPESDANTAEAKTESQSDVEASEPMGPMKSDDEADALDQQVPAALEKEEEHVNITEGEIHSKNLADEDLGVKELEKGFLDEALEVENTFSQPGNATENLENLETKTFETGARFDIESEQTKGQNVRADKNDASSHDFRPTFNLIPPSTDNLPGDVSGNADLSENNEETEVSLDSKSVPSRTDNRDDLSKSEIKESDDAEAEPFALPEKNIFEDEPTAEAKAEENHVMVASPQGSAVKDLVNLFSKKADKLIEQKKASEAASSTAAKVEESMNEKSSEPEKVESVTEHTESKASVENVSNDVPETPKKSKRRNTSKSPFVSKVQKTPRTKKAPHHVVTPTARVLRSQDPHLEESGASEKTTVPIELNSEMLSDSMDEKKAEKENDSGAHSDLSKNSKSSGGPSQDNKDSSNSESTNEGKIFTEKAITSPRKEEIEGTKGAKTRSQVKIELGVAAEPHLSGETEVESSQTVKQEANANTISQASPMAETHHGLNFKAKENTSGSEETPKKDHDVTHASVAVKGDQRVDESDTIGRLDTATEEKPPARNLRSKRKLEEEIADNNTVRKESTQAKEKPADLIIEESSVSSDNSVKKEGIEQDTPRSSLKNDKTSKSQVEEAENEVEVAEPKAEKAENEPEEDGAKTGEAEQAVKESTEVKSRQKGKSKRAKAGKKVTAKNAAAKKAYAKKASVKKEEKAAAEKAAAETASEKNTKPAEPESKTQPQSTRKSPRKARVSKSSPLEKKKVGDDLSQSSPASELKDPLSTPDGHLKVGEPDSEDHPALRTRSKSPIKRSIQELSTEIDAGPSRKKRNLRRRKSQTVDAKEAEKEQDSRGRPRNR